MNKKGLTGVEVMILLAILAGLGIGGWIASSDDQPIIINTPPAQTETKK